MFFFQVEIVLKKTGAYPSAVDGPERMADKVADVRSTTAAAFIT